MNFVRETLVRATPRQLYEFHALPDAFERLQPPWEQVQVVEPPSSLEAGTVVIARTRVGPLWVTIEAEHVACTPPSSENAECGFEDVMHGGPFKRWHHRHRFLPHPEGAILRDEIEYEPPLGPLGRLADPWAIRPRLERMFAYRHRITREAVERVPQHDSVHC
jgi:ligand-binding SRPBCC domain-containing protein